MGDLFNFRAKGESLLEGSLYSFGMSVQPWTFRKYALAIESVLRIPVAIFEDSEGSLVGLTRSQVVTLAKENSSSEKPHSQSPPKYMEDITEAQKLAYYLGQIKARGMWQLQ